ncbi:MAG: hypothetical protein ACE5HZ_05475 [Fidelibacterota bacterium]
MKTNNKPIHSSLFSRLRSPYLVTRHGFFPSPVSRLRSPVSGLHLLPALLLLLLPLSFTAAQFKSQDPRRGHQVPIPTGSQSSPGETSSTSIFSLMDPERFSMSHGFSLSMATWGNQSYSFGTYSNRLRYLFSDNWSLLARLDLVQPTYSTLPYASNVFSGRVYYGAQLLFQPSENLQFSIGVDTYPRLSRYGSFYTPYSPFQPDDR